jgi:hypothetical protein
MEYINIREYQRGNQKACKQCLPPLLTLFVLDSLVMFNTYCVVFNLIKIRSTHLLPIFYRVFFWSTFWLYGFHCIYGVWRSDWMVFAVFMGCDVLIGWFSLYLWGIQRKPSNQNVTPHKYSENHPIRTSHPINGFVVFVGCDVLIGWFSIE